MIDRRHPDSGLRVLISCLFERLYPSFSFFFGFKISVFRSCIHIYVYGVILVTSRQLVYSVATCCERIDIFCLRVILHELQGLTQAMHVNPCRAVKLRKTSTLMHLRIISAGSDKITKCKLKLLYVMRAS